MVKFLGSLPIEKSQGSLPQFAQRTVLHNQTNKKGVSIPDTREGIKGNVASFARAKKEVPKKEIAESTSSEETSRKRQAKKTYAKVNKQG